MSKELVSARVEKATAAGGRLADPFALSVGSRRSDGSLNGAFKGIPYGSASAIMFVRIGIPASVAEGGSAI